MTRVASRDHARTHELAAIPRYTAAEVAHFTGTAPRTMKAWLSTGAVHNHRVSFERMIEVLQQQEILNGELQTCDGRPIRWFPGGYDHHIAIDPNIGFGFPIIARRGIRTEHVAGRHCAGWDIEDIADDYDMTLEEVEAALAFELAKRAA